IIEGVGRQLYPDINMWEVAKPLIYKWMIKEKFFPKDFFKKSSEKAGDMASDILALPSQASEFFERALDEELRVEFTHPGIDRIAGNINNLGRRITRAIFAGSFVVGASIIAVFAPDDALKLMGLPLLSWGGYIIAVAIAIFAYRFH
ncbi:MAG: hypothetical protein V3V95_07755, partial [Thermodesulfobacteriota bacterium]